MCPLLFVGVVRIVPQGGEERRDPKMSERQSKVHEAVRSRLSRKEFLKAGTAVTVAVGLGDALTRVVYLGDGVVAFAGPHGSIVVDTLKCAGCQSCVLACSLGHTGVEDPGNANISITQESFEAYPDDISSHVRGRCDLCANTPYWDEPGGPDGRQACVEVCPMRAVQYQPA
jgi:ferredoxin